MLFSSFRIFVLTEPAPEIFRFADVDQLFGLVVDEIDARAGRNRGQEVLAELCQKSLFI